jgi:hypothetical protein
LKSQALQAIKDGITRRAVISAPAKSAEERLDRVIDAVAAERERQEQKHGRNTCASPSVPNGFKLSVLMEEVGEVAQALQRGVLDTKGREHLRTELIQVAAVAVAWAESLTPAEISTNAKRSAAVSQASRSNEVTP